MNKKSKTQMFGQHFLHDSYTLNCLVQQAEIQPLDAVLEIGAGQGVLTAELVKKKACVTAVEVDPRLCKHLERRFLSQPNFQLIRADALTLNWPELLSAKPKLVANLPYAVSKPILMHMLRQRQQLQSAVVMLQKEVALRLVADEKHPKHRAALSVFFQTAFDVHWVQSVSADCFTPPPKVESAIVKLVPKPLLKNEASFFDFVRQLFNQRRKKFWPRFAVLYPELAERVRQPQPTHWGNARPENLSVQEYKQLFFGE